MPLPSKRIACLSVAVPRMPTSSSVAESNVIAASSSSKRRHWNASKANRESSLGIGSRSISNASSKAIATSRSMRTSSCSVTLITYPVLHRGGNAQLLETPLSRGSEGPDGPIEEFARLAVRDGRIDEDEQRQQLTALLVERFEGAPNGASGFGPNELALVGAVCRAGGGEQTAEDLVRRRPIDVHVLSTSVAQDLTNLIGGGGRQPARQLLGLANRVQPLDESQPRGGEGVLAHLVIRRHHVDRLPDHPLESTHQRLPRRRISGERRVDERCERRIRCESWIFGHVSTIRRCVGAQIDGHDGAKRHGRRA